MHTSQNAVNGIAVRRFYRWSCLFTTRSERDLTTVVKFSQPIIGPPLYRVHDQGCLTMRVGHIYHYPTGSQAIVETVLVISPEKKNLTNIRDAVAASLEKTKSSVSAT